MREERSSKRSGSTRICVQMRGEKESVKSANNAVKK